MGIGFPRSGNPPAVGAANHAQRGGLHPVGEAQKVDGATQGQVWALGPLDDLLNQYISQGPLGATAI